MIKAITFDFWQTLYKSKPVDYDRRLKNLQAQVEEDSETSIERERFQAAVEVARYTWDQTWVEEHRTIGASEWLSIMLNQLGISLSPDYLVKIRAEMEQSVLNDVPSLVPEARSVLADLSDRYRLGVISDTGLTPGRVLRQLMEQDNITDYFTHLTFSDEIGRSKPHPDAFHTTLEALEAAPAEAVHVGDLLRTDIAGAKNVGMRGIQYIGVNQDDWSSAQNEPVIPDAIIKNHDELDPLLHRWHASS